jgi:hypothetical protein
MQNILQSLQILKNMQGKNIMFNFPIWDNLTSLFTKILHTLIQVRMLKKKL